MSSTQQLLLGEGAGGSAPVYIEDVFSTYLYTGNGSTQTITNNIDLSTKGGLVWSKDRGDTVTHQLFDSARGTNKTLSTANTNAQGNNSAPFVPTFLSTGFITSLLNNENAHNFVSWTFRKQPKFFDVVTWTGDDVIGREIPHNLGSVPGCIMVKQTNATRDWVVYHTSIGNTKYLTLNSTSPAGTQSFFNNTTPTSTVFTVGDWGAVNGGGNTYVAYLWANNAGGFGALGTDSVISCGSFVSNPANSYTPIIDLGWEPQWILTKSSSDADNWKICDTMRGLTVNSTYANALKPNSTDSEDVPGNYIWLNSESGTSFGFQGGPGQLNGTFIYIAIRKGPMKTPTDATTVFSPNYPPAAQLSPYTATTGFPVDLSLSTIAGSGPYNRQAIDRLRGNPTVNRSSIIQPNLTDAESSSGVNNYQSLASNTALIDNAFWSGYSLRPIYWLFRRAPSFFDEVCYTGTGANTTFTHNLGVVPELIIIKARSFGQVWVVGNSATGFGNYLVLNTTAAAASGSNVFNNTAPTSTVFSLGNGAGANQASATYVAYLFATCAGVSKVGSYTGTGALQTVNCGFTGGARFVLIKRTNTSGSWFVWDTARGMVSGTDPALTLNTTNAEFNADSVYSVATGFQLLASPAEAINTNGDTYIFLAIA
jgi:hypothetical protein